MSATSKSKMIIRKIKAGAEMHAVEALQKDVWGVPDIDVVPAAQLIASIAAGGVLLGAFDGDILAGFVFGFVGFEHGNANHHSHMLAIKPEYRSSNLGHRLKLAQRERVLEQGIDTMTWTFDPLQSQNAHINFSKLGVVSNRYLINFYGEDAVSFLHSNGTDRLWVTWLLNSRRVADRIATSFAETSNEGLKKLVEVGKNGAPKLNELADVANEERFVIEIPSNINDVQEQNIELAIEWREATRSAFLDSLAKGYLVEEFQKKTRDAPKNGGYVLCRNKKLEDIL